MAQPRLNFEELLGAPTHPRRAQAHKAANSPENTAGIEVLGAGGVVQAIHHGLTHVGHDPDLGLHREQDGVVDVCGARKAGHLRRWRPPPRGVALRRPQGARGSGTRRGSVVNEKAPGHGHDAAARKARKGLHVHVLPELQRGVLARGGGPPNATWVGSTIKGKASEPPFTGLHLSPWPPPHHPARPPNCRCSPPKHIARCPRQLSSKGNLNRRRRG